MNMPENMSRSESLRPIENGRWDELVEHFHSKAVVAEKLRLGIEVSYILRDSSAPGRHLVERNADQPMYSASLMKLGIAGKAVDADLPLEATVSWSADRRDTTGSGVYDRDGSPTEATVQLLVRDMLSRSGNTAARALVPQLGGAAGINDYLARHYDATSVIDAGNQAVIFGETTPYEALRMLRMLYEGSDTDLAKVARRALENNELTHQGIRRHMRNKPNPAYIIANKTGDYPGDDPNNEDDPYPIPYAVSHDVGLVQTAENQQIEYVVMTRSPRYDNGSKKGKLAHVMAEQTVSHMTAEIARSLLGRKVIDLGARALRY